MVNFYITEQSIIVNLGSKTHTISRDNKLADKIIVALRARDEDALPALIDQAEQISKFSNKNFLVKDGEIYFDGVKAPKILTNKILSFMEDGLPYQPLVEFAKKLQLNPSRAVVESLYGFMEHNGITITESGNIICYKRVRNDFLDIHSQTFDNSVGKVVEVPRNQVVEDRNVTCAAGLHVAAWDYAKNHYGSSSEDKMLEVEVDPADFVAIPTDYNEMKARVCKYIVRAVVDVPRADRLVYTSSSFDEDEEVENEDEDEDEGEYESYDDDSEMLDSEYDNE